MHQEIKFKKKTDRINHLAVFRRHGINRPFRPDSPDATTSGDNVASVPSFALFRLAGRPTSGEAGYSIPAGNGAASYSCRLLLWRCIVSEGLVPSPASSSSGKGVSSWSWCGTGGTTGCGLLRNTSIIYCVCICAGIAMGNWRSACSGLSKSGRRCSAVLCPDEGGEFPGDYSITVSVGFFLKRRGFSKTRTGGSTDIPITPLDCVRERCGRLRSEFGSPSNGASSSLSVSFPSSSSCTCA